ncbi:hypothetical protein F2Q70_00040336 [Brassica cretica]|uniref:Uncharacterized protein n=1 Tax=Brassica cretica TaxID=69181 RepID=A0A8S9K9W4_BRACR|nr:hypothetical protein F2Q70_00040336 [Brassica cretica]
MDRTGYFKLYSTSDLKQSGKETKAYQDEPKDYMASADPLLQGKLAAGLIIEKDQGLIMILTQLGFRTWEAAEEELNTT